jgi:hypothetical protein
LSLASNCGGQAVASPQRVTSDGLSLAGHFRSPSNNGHLPTGAVGPVRADFVAKVG